MGFHTVVCIKAVLMEAPQKNMVREPGLLELNPYDRPALETALRIRDERGGTVTALSMGPERTRVSLLETRAMGVDRAVLLCDPALKGSDTLATSTALGAATKKLAPFDLVLFGTRSADSDTGQVGPQTSVVLDIPLVYGVRRFEWRDAGLVVERNSDGFVEQFRVALPAALTIDSGCVQARDVGLAGIQTAFEQDDVEIWTASDLGLSSDAIGWAGSPTRVPSWRRVTRDRSCAFIEGTAREQVEKLMQQLMASGAIE